MSRPNRPLTPQQLEAARHLARGATGADAARAVGVRPETVSHWRRVPGFDEELRRLVALAETGDTRARVEALTPKALDALQAALTEPTAAPAVKIAAADALLRFAAAIHLQEAAATAPDTPADCAPRGPAAPPSTVEP